MKRAFAAVSLVLLMAFVSGCAAVSQNDGIYRATAQGRNGPISLEVEIGRDRRINDICVISHQETPEIGGVALQSLCSAIVQQQSLDVDSISGATVTTHAVLKAVSHALAIAGLEPDDYYPSSAPKSTDQIDETLETDVIVIGSGAAGFSAAVTACENGANVIMLDNMDCATMKAAVEMTAGKAKLEASGNVTLDNIREIAETGVDIISLGALTHSVTAFDISMKWKKK